MPDDLSSIFQFHPVSSNLSISGQPHADQFRLLKQTGYQAVLHLNIVEAPYALGNEQELVVEQGLTYETMTLSFEQPKESDFDEFSQLMDKFLGQKLHIHCTAGYCSSCLVFLYQVIHQGVAMSEAKEKLLNIWNPADHWVSCIDTCLKAHDIEIGMNFMM